MTTPTPSGKEQEISQAIRRAEIQSKSNLEHFLEYFDTKVSLVTGRDQLEKVEELEAAIWSTNGFGSIDEYDKYKKCSSVFAAFLDEECLGFTRIFHGGELYPPPFTTMDFFDSERKVETLTACSLGKIEEVGTLGVDHDSSEIPRGILSANMWRLAYRDAVNREVDTWGIIMEPERVVEMNEKFSFKFFQLGPESYYQGGMCAPFIMSLSEVAEAMEHQLPELYDWFVNDEVVAAN